MFTTRFLEDGKSWKIMENHGKSWQNHGKIMENHGKSCLSLGKYMEIPIMNHSMSYSSEDVTFLDHLKGATVEHRG